MSPQPEKTEFEKKLEEQAKAQRAAAPSDIEVRGEEADDGPAEAPGDEELPEMLPKIDVQALLAERDELKDQLLRTRAEFDNYRKRVARDAEANRRRAAESLLRDLLPVVDNLELALQHAEEAPGPLADGIHLVARQFHEVLRRAGVEPIPAMGESFDPNVHEAVMQAPSAEAAPNSVTQEFQRGYRLGEYVLRPSKVVVSTGTAEGSSNGAPPDSEKKP